MGWSSSLLIPNLAAKGNAAAQVGFGVAQGTDAYLLMCQVPQADGDAFLDALLFANGNLHFKERHGLAGLSVEAVAVGQGG